MAPMAIRLISYRDVSHDEIQVHIKRNELTFWGNMVFNFQKEKNTFNQVVACF